MAIEISFFEAGKPDSGDKCMLEGSGPFRIGRSEASHIPLDHLQVSRVHAEIEVDGSRIMIHDKDSQNGTLLARRRITSASWSPADEVQIGPFVLSVRFVDAARTEVVPAARNPGRSDAAPAAIARAASIEAVPPRPRRVEQPAPRDAGGGYQDRHEEAPPRYAPSPADLASEEHSDPVPPARPRAEPPRRSDDARLGPPSHGASTSTGQEPLQISWSGDPWDLSSLGLINWLLNFPTLGIYSFWAKTEVRKRIWSSVHLQGEPLAYTGTGKELFLGAVIVTFAVFLPVFLLVLAVNLAAGPDSPIALVLPYLLYIPLGFLWGIAIYRARRYRLSRTLWRGIRGSMTGSPVAYSWTNLWTAFLIPFTLGWIMPWRANRLQKALNGETAFGNRQLGYEGAAGPLYAYFAGLWIGGMLLYFLMIGIIVYLTPSIMAEAERAVQQGMEYMPSISLIAGGFLAFLALTAVWSVISAWYQARKLNLFASYTSFDQGRFKLNTTALGLIGVFITNTLLSALSLGILKPVAQARIAKYFVDNLSLEGSVDVASILQGAAPVDKRGEGLAQAFDVDAF